MNFKKVLFVALFTALVLVGSQINFSQVIGTESQYFTLFQFFGPMAGAFLGPVVGVVSVLGAQLINFVGGGKEVTLINLFRLTPMLFAAAYFGLRNRKAMAIVPLACMALFWMHPIGQQAWLYALYWVIPLAAAFTDRLFFKSLGATFTAHAIGSVAWLYTFGMTPEAWALLIPIVAFERGLFAIGISTSYVVMNTILAKIPQAVPYVEVNPQYVISKNFFRIKA